MFKKVVSLILSVLLLLLPVLSHAASHFEELYDSVGFSRSMIVQSFETEGLDDLDYRLVLIAGSDIEGLNAYALMLNIEKQTYFIDLDELYDLLTFISVNLYESTIDDHSEVFKSSPDIYFLDWFTTRCGLRFCIQWSPYWNPIYLFYISDGENILYRFDENSTVAFKTLISDMYYMHS